jgi:hypothetical protein
LLNYIIVVLVHPALLAALYLFLSFLFFFVYYFSKTPWYRHSLERLSLSFSAAASSSIPMTAVTLSSSVARTSSSTITTATTVTRGGTIWRKKNSEKEKFFQMKWNEMNGLEDIRQFHPKETDFQIPPSVEEGERSGGERESEDDEDLFNGISPMFETRTSSFFRKQRRITGGVEVHVREAMMAMTPIEELDTPPPSSPFAPCAPLAIPQITKISTIVSRTNIEQMFQRSSSADGLVWNENLFHLCDRVLNSLNISLADGPMTQEERNLVFEMISRHSLSTPSSPPPPPPPPLSMTSHHVASTTGLAMDCKGFMSWLEASLETVDIQRHSAKIQKMRSQHHQRPLLSQSSQMSSLDLNEGSHELQQPHQQQPTPLEDEEVFRDTDVSELTMESVFIDHHPSSRNQSSHLLPFTKQDSSHPDTILEVDEQTREKEEQEEKV